MTAEVINMREGTISWVSASANANGWTTAASSPSGVAVAFVRDINYTSAQTLYTVPNRGTPNHIKTVDAQAIQFSLTYAYSGYNGIPSYPVNVEIRHKNGDFSAFTQIYHVVRESQQFSEAAEENTFQDSFIALGYLEGTASGYLAHA